MSVSKLVTIAKDKDNFLTLEKYVQFCLKYLAFVEKGVQATIVSQNENHYRFWQYKADGHYNITRPINGNLMFTADEASVLEDEFLPLLQHTKDLKKADAEAPGEVSAKPASMFVRRHRGVQADWWHDDWRVFAITGADFDKLKAFAEAVR